MKKYYVLVTLMIAVMLGFSGMAQADLNDGLVAYYPFNGNADDESGNGNDGTVNGAKLTEDRFRNVDSAYSFDGEDDYIEFIPLPLINLSSGTISFWIKFDLTNATQIIVSGRHPTTSYYVSDYISIREDAKLYDSYTQTDYDIITDAWYHIVVTHEENVANTLFIKGEKISINNEYIGAFNSIKRYLIGAHAGDDGAKEFFNGCIDDFRIYNRVLSESEIQELYNETSGDITVTDSDNDGVPDMWDECPDTPTGSFTNSQGCSAEEIGEDPPSEFTGELAEDIQSYLTLTEGSVPFNLSPGSYVQAYGSNGMNTLNVEKYARLQCQNFIGENEINIEEASSQFTVYRSGATVYLNSTSGTRVEIAATETPQTLRFADGSVELIITAGNVMLGSQVVDETEKQIESALDNIDTSESVF